MLTQHHLPAGGKKTAHCIAGKEIKKVCHLQNVIPKIWVFFPLRVSQSSWEIFSQFPIEVKPSPSSVLWRSTPPWCFVAADIDTWLSPLAGVETSTCPLRTKEKWYNYRWNPVFQQASFFHQKKGKKHQSCQADPLSTVRLLLLWLVKGR